MACKREREREKEEVGVSITEKLPLAAPLHDGGEGGGCWFGRRASESGLWELGEKRG